MTEYISSERVFDLVGDKLCAHCPYKYYELGTFDCPTGFDVLDSKCIKHDTANDIAEVIDKANQEIYDLI